MKSTHWILLGLPIALSACKTTQVDRDAMSVNTVSRTYDKTPAELWSAVRGAMKELELKVDEDAADALGGELVAQRANKDRVRIEARSVDATQTRLEVAVDPGDRGLAQIIQDRVAEKLGASAGVTRTAFAAGSRLEGTYEQGLVECAGAAQQAMEALRLSGVKPEKHDTWMQVEGRHLDAIPARIRGERTPQDRTKVVFTAGTSPGDDNQALARRLKTEFERALGTGRAP